MDLNLTLGWIVAASCALGLVRLILMRRPRQTRGWLSVFGAILILFLILTRVRPEQAGTISAVPWVLLVMVPSLGSRLLNAAILRGQYGRAKVICRTLAVLHPFDGWRQQPRIVQALELLHKGAFDRARELLGSLRTHDTPLGRAAILLDAHTREDWPGFLERVESHPEAHRLREDTNIFCGMLWAMGELGQHRRMVATFSEWAASKERRDVFALSLVRLHVACLVGDTGSARHLLDGPLSALPEATRQFWLGAAEQVAGRIEPATEHLDRARSGAGAHLLRRIERRLEVPLPIFEAESIGADERATLDELRRQVAHESHYAVISSASRRQPLRVTWVLIAILAAVFCLELSGGSTDLANLERLGALVVPTSLTEGEWWRRFTAGFLHFGPLHLVLNLLSLLILGRWLERAWGRGVFLLAYLTASFASTGLLPFFSRASFDAPQVLVGASGGIMGLLGGLLAHLLVGRSQGRSPLITRQLSFLLVLVLLQSSFDMAVPNVSSTCHLLGLTTGFLFGLLFTPRISASTPPAPRPN